MWQARSQGTNCWSKKGKEGSGRQALGTDKSMCFKCKKVGHLKKDCPKLKDKKEKDGGMFLGMMECLEVKQEEAEMDDHFTAFFDCSVFLESNEGQAEFCAGAVGQINGWYEPSDVVDEERVRSGAMGWTTR